MRISMQFENRLCPLLRQRLSVRKEATSVALPRTEALYPHGGPPYVALPQTEALCLHRGPPFVALPQTEPPSVSVIATLVSPDRAVQQITARLPCTPDI